MLGVLAALALSIWTVVAQPKVAYVDSAVLLERYDRAVVARASLAEQVGEWERNAQTLQQEAEAIGKRMMADGLPRSTRDAIADTLNEKQRAFARYVEATSKKAAEREEDLLQPVYTELNARMERYSKERGIDLLLGTMSGGNILYGADGVDVTEDLLDYLNGGG